MREKYIELIIEYLKQRPDYKTNLNDIKANVLVVGATEEEFHEAIRLILNIPRSSMQENTGKRLLKDLNNRANKTLELVSSTKPNLKSKKKYFTAVAVLIIILIFTTAVGQ